MNYVIGYDLKKPGQDYGHLFEAIKGVGSNWWHCLDSTWIVTTGKSASEVCRALLPHIDTNDRILVSPLPPDAQASWYGFNQECGDWLQKYL